MSSCLLISHNRPEKTLLALAPLAECSKLYLFCDGPNGDVGKTLAVRKILSNVADVRTRNGQKTTLLFQEKNLGPQKGPISAIQQFFSAEESGHIIEDDIVVHPLLLEVHRRALVERQGSDLLWIGEGHPLPKCQSSFIETRINRLVAWSSWREPIQDVLSATACRSPWEEKGFALLGGLHIKTKVFLWKEFERLKRRPNWSWHYTWLQFQLDSGRLGLTPTTRLHKNLGVDGSGHNCQNVFGAVESWSDSDLARYKEKPNFIGTDGRAERLLELQRYGRIRQSIGRKLMSVTPRRLRWIWRPVTNNDIHSPS